MVLRRASESSAVAAHPTRNSASSTRVRSRTSLAPAKRYSALRRARARSSRLAARSDACAAPPASPALDWRCGADGVLRFLAPRGCSLEDVSGRRASDAVPFVSRCRGWRRARFRRLFTQRMKCAMSGRVNERYHAPSSRQHFTAAAWNPQWRSMTSRSPLTRSARRIRHSTRRACSQRSSSARCVATVAGGGGARTRAAVAVSVLASIALCELMRATRFA